jgi:hypothetical protein
MSYEKLVRVIRGSFYETLIVGALLTMAFMAIEPIVSHSQSDSETFLVTQTVSDAIAFAASTTDVVMAGTLNGLTGGSSYGTTTARVTTNNAAGFTMTIAFSSTTAMARSTALDTPEIYNYLYSTSTASYPTGFDTSVANAQFGFSVNASTTGDVADTFLSSGSACGSGTFTLNNCWRGASSTDETFGTELIDRSTATPGSGTTSTVQFRITIPNGPSPSVPNGTYTATATLTAVEN